MLKQWYAVIVAGGTGSRFGGSRPKQFYLLESRPVLQWSIDAFFQCPSLTRLVVVSHPDWIEETGRIIRKQTFSDRITLVPGGSYRQDSCRNGLRSLPDEPDAPVLIHD
ncbi:2-C-methyl-D-erythritol 4-phosphate cytidylyltransferase, partial [bacterium]|nr:2-C-methyl-D-erythritol 4-phosphate cytidylyltransferase [candidate division CSSED10-310 bacterium]